MVRCPIVVPCNFARGIRSGPNAGKVAISPADRHARAEHLLLTPQGKEVAQGHTAANGPQRPFE
jgi:hypothetical protein